MSSIFGNCIQNCELFNLALAILWMCAGILEWNPIKRVDNIACEPVGFNQCIFEVKRLIFCCDRMNMFLFGKSLSSFAVFTWPMNT